MRRFLFLAIGLFFLGACGATDTAAISVGDRSITAEELATFSEIGMGTFGQDSNANAAVQFAGIDTELVVNADILRQLGVAWLQNAAAVQLLEERGIVLTDGQRVTVEAQLSQIIGLETQARLLGTETYESFVDLIWLNDVGVALDGAQEELRSLMASAQVSSRLGVFDPDTVTILPPG